MSWQHLKTGYSERTLFKQGQAFNSSSSLGFAIDCLNSSHPQGNLLFIDLRNRNVQRREVHNEKKEEIYEVLLRETKRKAENNIDAEMAQLEKRWWQCHCLSAFANQCLKRLMRLSPRTAQLKSLLKNTTRQLKGTKRVTDKDEIQLDDEKKTFKEKEGTAKEKAQKNTGEERIQEAKIVWLKDCKKIMHAREKMRAGEKVDEEKEKEKVLGEFFGYFSSSGRSEKLDNEEELIWEHNSSGREALRPEELLWEHFTALASIFRAYATAEDDSAESNSTSCSENNSSRRIIPGGELLKSDKEKTVKKETVQEKKPTLLLTHADFKKMLQDCRLMSERGAQVTSRHIKDVWKKLPTAPTADILKHESLDMSRFLQVLVLLSSALHKHLPTHAPGGGVIATESVVVASGERLHALLRPLLAHARRDAAHLVKDLIHDDGAKACDNFDVCTASFFREVRSIRSIPSCGIAFSLSCVCAYI